jgi:hypothetical protein
VVDPALCITFDIDWAPDWAIALCADLCRGQGVKATFFATHPTAVLQDLLADPLFEVGIHPNFLPSSTQGKTHRAVLDYCMNLVPSAKAMRTHDLYQSTSLFKLIGTEYRAIETDVSVLLFLHPGLRPVTHRVSETCMTRLPFFWEDDIAAMDPNWDWRSGLPESVGLRIFDFHPVHIALNTADLANYEALKAALRSRSLHEADQREFRPFRHQGEGTLTFFRRLIETVPPSRFSTVSEVTKSR